MTYNPLQAALNDMGITRPRPPGWLPDGFAFDGLQTTDMQNNKIITMQYKRGEETIILTFFVYKQSSTGSTRIYEKSAGTPLEYERNGIIHYIFNNLDVTVATWLDGLCECNIQGKISVEEMKSIIDSMY
jgi:hypothetical protein